jgi:Predicted permease
MYTGRLFNERLKQVGFLLLILFLVCIVVDELRYFLSSIMASFTLYLILRKPHQRLLRKGWRNSWATALLMFLTFLILLVIGSVVAGLVYDKLKAFHPQTVLNGIQHIHNEVIQRWGYNIFSEDIISKAVSTVGNILPGIISTTGNVVANLAMMVFILFFMLHQSAEFEKAMEGMIPLSEPSIALLKKETNNIVISNAIGIPMIIVGQGIFAGIGYWIFGAGDPVIWGLATGLFGLIPVIGTAGIWLPLAVNLLIGGSVWQGISLILWGACIVSNVDNVIRMVFLKKQANIHPLIALLGVILGINLFGFWGVIFGPLLLSGTLLLLRIFKSEFLRT